MQLAQPYFIDKRAGDAHLSLDGAWDFTWQEGEVDPGSLSYPYQTELPASLYHSLWRAGVLPHPYEGTNSEKYHWVDEKVWYYRKKFLAPQRKDHAFLVFEGVAYYCRIWLNGTLLGDHEGMMGGPSVDIAAGLCWEAENELIVEVKAANYGKKEGYDGWNLRGENREIAPWNVMRDTATSNGHFIVVGIWNRVRIEFLPKLHLSRPYLVTERIDQEGAHLSLECEIADGTLQELHPWQGREAGCYDYTRAYDSGITGARRRETVDITCRILAGDEVVYEEREPVPLLDFPGLGMDPRYYELQFYRKKILLPSPRLWYPQGMGEPFLYRVELSASQGEEILDQLAFDFGVRTFEAGETAGEKYRTGWNKFLFSVNGKPFFIKGMNWTPIDYLYDISPERYRWCLSLVKNAGIQMLRVWNGGGIPETDTFYRLCDEMGILVWQDQLIANTKDTHAYPHDILESQLGFNLYRLRNHPSLVLLCGGNEFNPYTPGNAAAMFVERRVTEALAPDRIYHDTTADRGSAHVYNDMEPTWYRHRYRDLPFLAESGIHSFPSFRSIRRLISEREATAPLPPLTEPAFPENFPELLHHFSEYIPARVPRMLARISQIIPLEGATLKDLCEASQAHVYEYYQLMAQAMWENYPKCGGVMPWVFKRPWTTTAVQTVDGDDRPGYAYYGIQNAYRPLAVLWCQEWSVLAPEESLPLTCKILGEGEGLETALLRFTVYRPDLSVYHEWEAPCRPKVEWGRMPLPAEFTDTCFLTCAEVQGERGEILARSVYMNKCTSLLREEQVYKAHRAAPQNNLYFENGPWLKPTLQSAASAKITARLGKTGWEGEYPMAEILLKNAAEAPAYPVTLDLGDGEEGRCYLSENFFLLKPGEEKRVRLVADSPFREVKICAWNAEEVVLSLEK